MADRLMAGNGKLIKFGNYLAADIAGGSVPVANDPTLQIWYDGQDSTTYNPGGTVGTNITQWSDKSATAHNAAPVGAAATRPVISSSATTNNKLCLYFDGGDGLAAPMGSNLQNKSGASLIVVAKTDAANANMQLIQGAVQSGNNYSDANGFYIMQDASTGYTVKFASGVATTSTLPDTSWHIFTLIFDGSKATNADRVKFYRNGSELTLSFSVNANPATSATINSILFGVDHTKAANFLTGYIGEVLVYNTTLTAAQQSNTELYLKNRWGLVY